MIIVVLNTCKNINILKAPDTTKEVISGKWVPQSRSLTEYMYVPESFMRKQVEKKL